MKEAVCPSLPPSKSPLQRINNSVQAIDPVTGHIWHSEKLLKGKKTVGIVHNGSHYKLQATKLGKLILTK